MHSIRLRLAGRLVWVVLAIALFVSLSFSGGRFLGKMVRRIESSLYGLIEVSDARENALHCDTSQDVREARDWRSRK